MEGGGVCRFLPAAFVCRESAERRGIPGFARATCAISFRRALIGRPGTHPSPSSAKPVTLKNSLLRSRHQLFYSPSHRPNHSPSTHPIITTAFQQLLQLRLYNQNGFRKRYVRTAAAYASQPSASPRFCS